MSRAEDPQLHTHVVAANMARGADGRWTALDATPIYQHAKAAGYLYQAHLRAAVRERLPCDGGRCATMSPELVEEFVSHFDRLRRAGRRTDPDAHAFPNTRGGRIARQRVAQVVGEAASHASERVTQRGLPPLPHTTPHTLRRTYISIALLANRFDVLWVIGQVGHADSKMTLDVYTQLQQRVKREHGRAFDTLVRQAREQLYGGTSGLPEPASEPVSGHASGHEATLGGSEAPRDRADRRAGIKRLAGGSRDGETRTRTGDTTIFSRVELLRVRGFAGVSSVAERLPASAFFRTPRLFAGERPIDGERGPFRSRRATCSSDAA